MMRDWINTLFRGGTRVGFWLSATVAEAHNGVGGSLSDGGSIESGHEMEFD